MTNPRKQPASQRALALLVVSSGERQSFLSAVLRKLGVDSISVRRCRQAREFLRTRPLLDAVLTDTTLEDANWCDVLRAVIDYESPASVVVVAPSSADERLWSEVIWRGAYDMLVEPFTADEARRVLEGALRTASSAHLALAVAS
jgi:DNA-binding NtrC family response regulator